MSGGPRISCRNAAAGNNPYYAGLLDKTDPLHPLRRAVVPVKAELANPPGKPKIPLERKAEARSRAWGIAIPTDRVLFLVTDFCSTYCRYCTDPAWWAAVKIITRTIPDGKNRWPIFRKTPRSGMACFPAAIRCLFRTNPGMAPAASAENTYVEIVRIGTKVPWSCLSE